MSVVTLILVGVLYLLTAVDMFVQGKDGMCAAFVCYAIANFGLLYEVMK